ncbi:MAG: AAA family ATPase [Marinilabiliales bacterium]|nr:AAA family ATPase [Marinilabiliales bacterium]
MRRGRNFIQVIAGPRQVGKTTLISQLLGRLEIPSKYISADGAEASG